jgi:hypothetical protein
VEDFASALVLAMVRRSLARQSIAVPGSTAVGERTVNPAEKRALLDGMLDAHGPEAILHVADVVPEFADHPVAGVFAGCREPNDVVASWLAIERYFHSRHRTRVVDRGPNRIVMEHFDTRGSPISAGENLAVAGLILGILRWRGAVQAVLSFERTATLGDVTLAEEETHRWTIYWEGFDPSPGAHSEQHEGLVPAVDFSGRAVSNPLVVRLFAEQLGAPHGRRGAAVIAKTLGLSLRTLQRRLAGAGWSLGDIVASARVYSATRLLAATDTPLALENWLGSHDPHDFDEQASSPGEATAAENSASAAA